MDDTAIQDRDRGALMRMFVIGTTSFLTQVDLFGAQAILPSLVAKYQVTPAQMGVAVNASTIGMAVTGLLIAVFSRRFPRPLGIWVAMALLAAPTFFLATAPDLNAFIFLRIVQGVFMAAAFTLTMAYLAEVCTASETAAAMAAYITGSVLANLAGRLVSAGITSAYGVEGNFQALAALNLIGAAFVYYFLGRSEPHKSHEPPRPAYEILKGHFRNMRLAVSFLIGFIILFVFIGAFTYVNYELVGAPFNLSKTQLGLVYLVFLPSVITTPLAGALAVKAGVRRTFWISAGLSILGLLMLLSMQLPIVLAGLALFAAALFFAQAAVTGFVGQAAMVDRAAASGLYLAAYYFGGLVGALAVGRVYEAAGWSASIFGMAGMLVIAIILAFGMKITPPMRDAAMTPG